MSTAFENIAAPAADYAEIARRPLEAGPMRSARGGYSGKAAASDFSERTTGAQCEAADPCGRNSQDSCDRQHAICERTGRHCAGGRFPAAGNRRRSIRIYSPASAATFSAHLLKRLPGNRNTLLLCGMESHICVMQTALAALRDGYLVHVASDAVSSRTEWNWKIGLDRMRAAGAVISSTEMMIYELMRSSASAGV